MGYAPGMIKGKDLEKRANHVNIKERLSRKSLILQIPTPILFTNRGYVVKESTVDFAGLVTGGKFLAFDAKETASQTSFPLSNIKQHQLNYLTLVEELGGISFFLIHFKTVYKDKAFYVPCHFINEYTNTTSKKSIPLKFFKSSWLVNIDNYLTEVLKIYECERCKDIT